MSEFKSYNTRTKYYTKLSIGSYERPDPFDNSVFKPENYILLPLPQELRDETPLRYNEVDLQLSGDILNGDILSGVGSEVLRRSGDMATGALSGVTGGLASMISPALGNITSGIVKEALPPSQVTSAIQQYFGIAPNPNASVAFQGPVLRDISFSWVLMPTTPSESENVKTLVSLLKRSALPENSISKSGAILNYPKLVQVNFFPWDNKDGFSIDSKYGWSNNSIIKMKRCFMSAVNVNYTPSNTPAFFGGTNAPVFIQLSITFKEIEYFLSSDHGGTSTTDDIDAFLKSKTTKAEQLKTTFDSVPTAIADYVINDTAPT